MKIYTHKVFYVEHIYNILTEIDVSFLTFYIVCLEKVMV